jgi:3-oxoacyl-[acyl-carrier-protein] synthase-3
VFEKTGLAIVGEALAKSEIEWGDISRVLVHQVTVPYVKRFMEATGAPEDKLVHTIADHGNMASATLGVQLSKTWSDLKPGELVLMVGLGGGVSVMTMLWEVS